MLPALFMFTRAVVVKNRILAWGRIHSSQHRIVVLFFSRRRRVSVRPEFVCLSRRMKKGWIRSIAARRGNLFSLERDMSRFGSLFVSWLERFDELLSSFNCVAISKTCL